MEFPFCGPNYRLDTPNAAPDRTINMYCEPIEKGPRAGKLRMRGIPGLRLFKSVGTGPIRCLWSNASSCYAVSGSQLWEVFSDATPNKLIGNIAPGTNPAIIQSNGFQLAISSGGQGFITATDPSGNPIVIPIVGTDGAPVNIATLAFIDNYFIGAIQNSRQVRISNLAPNGGVWDPGDAATKEGYSDNIIRCYSDSPAGSYLWLFGEDSLEIWTDTGGLFPFSRIPSMLIPIGCDSAWSVAGVSGFRAWLWHNVIWGCTGTSPARISDFGIERVIESLSEDDQDNSEAFAFEDRGHIWYVISFPISGITFAYDVTTQFWYEWRYFSNGAYGRYRPRVFTRVFGMNLVGDYATANIYQLDPLCYVDAPPIQTPDAAGVPLRRERICSYITEQEKNFRYNRLTLDMDTGIGLVGAEGVPGVDPMISMQYSPNRGKNWSTPRQSTLGEQGDNQRRIFWTQLGSSRIGMTFSAVITDPVPTSINGAYIDLSPGTWPRN